MNYIQSFQTDSPVFNQMLSLLRSALWGEERFPYQAPQDVNWAAIITELKHQTVQYLPIDLLIRENPSQSQHYITATAKSMMRWYNIMQEQQAICKLLYDSGIPCAVAKGAAAASFYPQPWKRLIGDIDLLVSPADFDSACSLIAEGSEYLGENYRHKEYKRNNIIIEIHRSFSTLRDSRKRELFDQRIFGSISAAKPIFIDGYIFYCLPTVENGLTLLEHINIHLEGGLGLRQIIDWMMYVDKELTDELWHTEYEPMLQQFGLVTLAVTVTRMCQMYLGLRTDITWCFGADESLCHELMEYILRQGNFGRKTQEGFNRAASVISVSGNPFSFFRILQRRGCMNWKALERYPFLKPFAWLYQLVRYIRHGFRVDHPVQFLKNAVKRSKSQSSFLEALGVSRMAQEGQIQK